MNIKHNGITFTFHRGFVESITCSWSDWQAHAAAIRAATPLRKVRLTTMPPFGEGWPGTINDVHASLGRQYPGITFELPHIHASTNPLQYRVNDFRPLFWPTQTN